MFRRSNTTPRENWQSKVEAAGLTYHTNEDGSAYWDESMCYRFEMSEAVAIRDSVAEMHRLIMAGVSYVVENPHLITERFAIPENYVPYILESYKRRDPHLLGRFDIAFDPETKAAKMIEFNGDTPTLLVEALVQRQWKEEFIPNAKQFNTVHDRLLTMFERLAPHYEGSTVYFVSVGGQPYDEADSRPWSVEEYRTCIYMMERAQAAGITAKWLDISDVGFNAVEGFTDLDDNPIRYMVKMYPWDWMSVDEFGQHLPEDERIRLMEPVWKMLAVNKALMPILWELFPNHPNLLPSFFGDSQDHTLNESGDYFVKPITARWGENIVHVKGHEVAAQTEGNYADMPLIYQAAGAVPRYDGQTVIIGAYTVAGKPAGMILREAPSSIVTNENSRIVPHYVME